MKKILLFLITLLLTTSNTYAEEKKMILKLKNGDVEIELFPKIAPKHVERFEKLANEGKYDGVVFHRVIDGFMAQTGDVQFGKSDSGDYDLRRAGMEVQIYLISNKNLVIYLMIEAPYPWPDHQTQIVRIVSFYLF